MGAADNRGQLDDDRTRIVGQPHAAPDDDPDRTVDEERQRTAAEPRGRELEEHRFGRDDALHRRCGRAGGHAWRGSPPTGSRATGTSTQEAATLTRGRNGPGSAGGRGAHGGRA